MRLFFISILLITTSLAHAAAVKGQGTWETTLLARDLDGDQSNAEAYFDTALGITWMKDANYDGYTRGIPQYNAVEWAANLNPYGSGIGGWRLPNVTDIGVVGCGGIGTTYDGSSECGVNNPSTGEMAHLFYVTLGNLSGYDTSGNPQAVGLTNTGPFSHLYLEEGYWSGTDYAPDTRAAYSFGYGRGSTVCCNAKEVDTINAWAVHDGDVGVAVIPIPTTVLLLGSALFGLFGIQSIRHQVELTKFRVSVKSG